MRRNGHAVLIFCLIFLIAGVVAANDTPEFDEVLGIVRSNLTGATAAELNKAAVDGLVSQLSPRVMLLTNGAAAAESRPLIAKQEVYDGGIVYLRIGRISDGLPGAVVKALEGILETNRINGLALDLRFTDGEDFAAAAGTADLFVRRKQPLLDWGKGPVESTAKWDAVAVPVAALVNGETARAAEALAAVLRETKVALLIGSRTSGQTALTRDFKLRNGQRLRIATEPIKLGDGTPLPPKGVEPDIEVKVKPENEKIFFDDPYAEISRGTNLVASVAGTFTNRITPRRISEADLVRERRENLNRDAAPEEEAEPEGEMDRPLVQDPTLSRALDLLKGLAVLRPATAR